MPTYLVHGFRWHRQQIIIHIVVHDLDACSPDWISSPESSKCLLDSFSSLYSFMPPRPPSTSSPDDATTIASSKSSTITLLEEYDPSDISSASSKYAYVTDHVVRIDLSCDVAEEIAKYDGTDSSGVLLEKLKNEIQKEPQEEIKWYVVVCGDEDRGWPGKDEEQEEKQEEEEGEEEEEQQVVG